MDAALAAWGLVEERDEEQTEAEPAVYHIWPENWDTWRIWNRIQTQWQVGFNGRTGLNYAGVTAYLRDVVRVRPRHFTHKFMCIQAMELAALDEWAKQRQQNTEG
ncbi:DUF1799 domain-containing protein [Rhodoferax sp. BLA1]|uniref:DUF1799 domain-containing protein n=1 Tax=Rhodoferax sp. BLA1 TaxID=2576062 RepID=UPI0015D3FAB0